MMHHLLAAGRHSQFGLIMRIAAVQLMEKAAYAAPQHRCISQEEVFYNGSAADCAT